MATVTAVVPLHQQRKDGTYNVKLRITHDRRSKYLPTSIYVTSSQITASGKIKDYAALDAVDALVGEIRAEITAIAYRIDKLTVDEVIVEIKRQRAAKEPVHFPLFEFARKRLSKKEGYTAIADDIAFKSFEKFYGADPDISDIKPRLLRQYIEWLQTDHGNKPGDSDKKGQKRLRPKSATTVERYVSSIRWAYNEARKEYNDYDDEIIRISGDPFEFLELPARRKAEHRALTVAQVQALIDCEARTEMEKLAKDMFVISLGLQGMNLRDIADIKVENGQCRYRRHKVSGRTGAEMVCRIEPEVMAVLSRHTDADGRFVHSFASYHSLLTSVDIGMLKLSAALGFKATLYSARHSWATFARNECGADKWTVHEALMHSSRETDIDDIYIRPDYTRIWELNRKVLDLFDFVKISLPLR